MKRLSYAVMIWTVTALSSSALAGIAEKKAYDAIDKGLAAKIAEVKTWCKNASMTMSVQRDPRWKAPEIGIAATNILTDFFEGLSQVCADADYRAAVSKLKKITFSLTDKEIPGTPKGIFRLKNAKTTLHVVVHVTYSLSNGISTSVAEAIKKLY